MGAQKIAHSTEEKYLGVVINQSLSPSHHIATCVSRANRIVGLIKRTYENKSKRNIIALHNSLVRPHLGRVHTCSGSRSGPVPLVRVAFTPAKIDRTRSGCGPVTRSHLFRNATGTRTVIHPPQHTGFLILGLLSSRRVTALTASRHRRRRSRIDGQIRRCVMCPNFGLQRNFGRCIFI